MGFLLNFGQKYTTGAPTQMKWEHRSPAAGHVNQNTEDNSHAVSYSVLADPYEHILFICHLIRL